MPGRRLLFITAWKHFKKLIHINSTCNYKALFSLPPAPRVSHTGDNFMIQHFFHKSTHTKILLSSFCIQENWGFGEVQKFSAQDSTTPDIDTSTNSPYSCLIFVYSNMVLDQKRSLLPLEFYIKTCSYQHCCHKSWNTHTLKSDKEPPSFCFLLFLLNKSRKASHIFN